MPLHTYQSDQAEQKAAKGKGSNPLFYLGGLAFSLGSLFIFSRGWRYVPLFIGLAIVVGVLGATGRLGFMTPLWDAIQQAWPY